MSRVGNAHPRLLNLYLPNKLNWCGTKYVDRLVLIGLFVEIYQQFG
jgi:hypothetical protein